VPVSMINTPSIPFQNFAIASTSRPPFYFRPAGADALRATLLQTR
jgi:hypothetical protein